MMARYAFSLGFAPDGNISSGNDSVNGNWTYTYDDLNRLQTAVGGAGYGCAEAYDRYGNRWRQDVYGGSCFTPQPSFTGGNNRMDGYSYDAAGNLLNDGNHSYTYDAENRILAVDGGSTATYVYDAEGRRVQRTSGAGTAYYVYDTGGRAITEINSSGVWARGEVYAGGRHLATYMNGTTYFVHSDWLGNERLRTQVDRTPYSSWTNLPFGEGTNAPDPSPLHFTGKERDSETGFDYFGARYYGSVAGRFISTDWDSKPVGVPFADLSAPQSLNLYAYAGNNPISRIDSDGHDCVTVMKWTLVCWNRSEFNSANDAEDAHENNIEMTGPMVLASPDGKRNSEDLEPNCRLF